MSTPKVPPPAWMFWVLAAAAVYNLIWGIGLVLLPNQPFVWAGMEPCNYPSLVQCLAMVIGVYGIGYAIAARDPVSHWPIVLVGLLGKIFGPLGFLWTAAHGELPWTVGWMILTNDLIWWLPFTAILIEAARSRDANRDDLGTFQEEMERVRTSAGESLWTLSQRQPVLVVFVRHAGCTFCREAVHDVGQQHDQIAADGVKPVIVHMGSVNDGLALRKWSGRTDLEMISDPDRRLFRAFDLQLGTLCQLSGPFVIWRALFGGTVFKYGFGQMIGNGMQLAGAFVVDHGRIVSSYRHQTTADRPDYAAIACRR